MRDFRRLIIPISFILLLLRIPAYVAGNDTASVKNSFNVGKSECGTLYIRPDGTPVLIYRTEMVDGVEKWHINIGGNDSGPFDHIIYDNIYGYYEYTKSGDTFLKYGETLIPIKRGQNLFSVCVSKDRSKFAYVSFETRTKLAKREGSSSVPMGAPWVVIFIPLEKLIPGLKLELDNYTAHTGGANIGKYDRITSSEFLPNGDFVVMYENGKTQMINYNGSEYPAAISGIGNDYSYYHYTESVPSETIFSSYKKGKLTIVHNGKPVNEYKVNMDINWDFAAFSKDLKHIAFSYRDNYDRFFNIDGKVYGGISSIFDRFTFTDDGLGFWYTHTDAKEIGKHFININGTEYFLEGGLVKAPVFGPSSSTWKYIFRTATGFAINNTGKISPIGPVIDETCNSVELAATKSLSRFIMQYRKGDKCFVWIDGRTIPVDGYVYRVGFSPCDLKWYYVHDIQNNQNNVFVNIDGKDYKAGDRSGFDGKVEFSNGDRMFYLHYKGFLNINGKVYERACRFNSTDDPDVMFSSDGTRYLFSFGNSKCKEAVNINGAIADNLEHVTKLQFSPHGRKYGYLHSTSSRVNYININGRNYGPYEYTDFIFKDDDSAIIAYVNDGLMCTETIK